MHQFRQSATNWYQSISIYLLIVIENRYQSITTQILAIDGSSIIHINWLIDIDWYRLSKLSIGYPGIVRHMTSLIFVQKILVDSNQQEFAMKQTQKRSCWHYNIWPDWCISHQSHYFLLYNGIPEFMRKPLMLTVKWLKQCKIRLIIWESWQPCTCVHFLTQIPLRGNGKVIFVLHALHLGEQKGATWVRYVGARGHGMKGELAMISDKFSFVLRAGKEKYHWLKNDFLEIKGHW